MISSSQLKNNKAKLMQDKDLILKWL